MTFNHRSLHAPHPTVIADILSASRHFPHSIAIRTAHGCVTLSELTERAWVVAQMLEQREVGAGATIGVMFPRSTDWVVAMLGCWMAGCAFVPLDPGLPMGRIAVKVRKAGVTLVLVPEDGPPVGLPAAVACAPIDAAHRRGSPPIIEAAQALPDAPAYVLFTSGSSGEPKGVVVDHAALRFSTRARVGTYGAATGTRVLVPYSVSFDSSLAGLLWALASGGEAVLLAPQAERDLHDVAATIRREAITHLDLLPSVLGSLLDVSTDDDLATVRAIVVGGEELPASVAARCRERLPQVALYNEYGPTEATIWATVERIDSIDPDERVSIGRPIPGMTARIVDESAASRSAGHVGELWLAGPGLAQGYIGDDALTAERFVESDGRRWYRTGDLAVELPDGRLRWLGRVDQQVKLNGFRIELEEVEHVLRGIAGVADAAAAVFGEAGHRRLVGFIVPEPGQTVTSTHLRRAAGERLPAHMVPTMIMPLTSLPRNDHGKLDRSGLADPWAPLPPPSAAALPDGDEARWLAETCAALVGRPHVGTDHNFFELGGTSILAMRLMAHLQRDLGVRLDLRDLFYRTLADVADDIRRARRAASADAARVT